MVCIIALPDALHFPVQDEAFSAGVIPAVSFAAHAADEAMFGQHGLVMVARILAAAVGKNDQSCRRPASLNGHAQSIADQSSWYARRHRPAHEPAREQVEHDSQIQPAGASADLRDAEA